MAELRNVTIETSKKYSDFGTGAGNPILKLTIPLPGGTAVYEIGITQDVSDSLDLASKLSKKGVE